MQEYKDVLKANKRLPNHTANFLKEQNLAVYVYLTTLLSTYNKELRNMNWDMVSIPTFKETPKVGSQAYPTYFGITRLADKPDAAMQVLSFLISEEFQKEESQQGITPILRSESVRRVLLEESEFKDKNLQAIFYHPFAPIASRQLYESGLTGIYGKIPGDVLWGGVSDLNTAMRNAEEQSIKIITAYHQQNK